jgi:hypothetical protein
MNPESLRITPTTARLDPEPITNPLWSIHKLERNGLSGPIGWFLPFRTSELITFDFVAISEGRDEPVEFYYGADHRLVVLEQRLRSTYPPSFDIDRVEVVLVGKLHPTHKPQNPLDGVTPYEVRWAREREPSKGLDDHPFGLFQGLEERTPPADEENH